MDCASIPTGPSPHGHPLGATRTFGQRHVGPFGLYLVIQYALEEIQRDIIAGALDDIGQEDDFLRIRPWRGEEI